MDNSPIKGALFNLSHTLDQASEALRPATETFLHYCSLEAFYSIMDTGRLRYTSAKSTNDPSEFHFGQEIVRDELARLAVSLPEGRGRLLVGCDELLSERTFRAFVFCMSEADDEEVRVGELSQWRMYGADGRGVALVVRDSPDESPSLLQRMGSIPRKVVYGRSDGAAIVAGLVEDFLTAACNLSDEGSKYILDNLIEFQQYLLNVVFWLPSVIKHPAYIHEREVRLVRGDIGETAGNPLVFFDKGGIRRPAIERSISELSADASGGVQRSAIEAVIIGPSGDQAPIEDSLKYYLEARNWDLDVRRSDIPYRAI